MIKVTTVNEAWTLAKLILKEEALYKDELTSRNAGYDVFRGENYYNYVCDLKDRLEVNCKKGETVNIWFETEDEPLNETEDKPLNNKETSNNDDDYINKRNLLLIRIAEELIGQK